MGYALNKRMTADLVCQALNNAIKYKRPARGLIVHSDRGIQYCSYQYRQIIEKHGLAVFVNIVVTQFKIKRLKPHWH